MVTRTNANLNSIDRYRYPKAHCLIEINTFLSSKNNYIDLASYCCKSSKQNGVFFLVAEKNGSNPNDEPTKRTCATKAINYALLADCSMIAEDNCVVDDEPVAAATKSSKSFQAVNEEGFESFKATIMECRQQLTELYKHKRHFGQKSPTDAEIINHFTNSIASRSESNMEPLSRNDVYKSPIATEGTGIAQKICRKVYLLISCLLEPEKDVESIWNDENGVYSPTVSHIMSIIVHAINEGRLIMPEMRRLAITTNSITKSQRENLSHLNLSPSFPTCSSIAEEAVQTMVRCTDLLIRNLSRYKVVMVRYDDNYNRRHFQTTFNANGVLTTQHVTQTHLFLILRAICFPLNFLRGVPTNGRYLPVKVFANIETALSDFVTSVSVGKGLAGFIAQMKKKFNYPKCVRETCDPRTGNFLTKASLQGSSAKFKIYADDTMLADTPDSEFLDVQIHDTEYDGHDAKIIVGHSIMPHNEVLAARAKRLNDKAIPPPPLHVTMHACDFLIERKVNFDLILSHFTRIISGTYKFKYGKPKKKAVTTDDGIVETKNLEDEEDADDEAEEEQEPDDDEEDIPIVRKRKRTPIKALPPMQPKHQYGERSNCCMNFQKLYGLLELLYTQYIILKDTIVFKGKNAEFYDDFFNVELPLAMKGLMDWRLGDCSTFIESLPLIILYFVMSGQSNMVNICLFHYNNLLYWKKHRPEVLQGISMNADYLIEELTELVHGQVANKGHLNRKNPDDALLDIARTFVCQSEMKLSGKKMAKHGEIFDRAHELEAESNDMNKRLTLKFIKDLANDEYNKEYSKETPFHKELQDSLGGVKHFVIDYIYHFSCSMFKEEVKQHYDIKLQEGLDPLMFYPEQYRDKLQLRGATPEQILTIAGPSYLEDQTADCPILDMLLDSSVHFAAAMKKVSGKFLSFNT